MVRLLRKTNTLASRKQLQSIRAGQIERNAMVAGVLLKLGE
jgi:hypothetical protein